MTAVEWLEVKLDNIGLNSDIIGDYIQQAKEMEKQQIIDAYERGDKYKSEPPGTDYYKETFNK